MSRWWVFLLVSVLLDGQTVSSPAKRFEQAKKAFLGLTKGDFLHDDSTAAVAALNDMRSAEADFVVQLLSEHSDASAGQIKTELCRLALPDEGECDADSVVLGPGVFLVAHSVADGIGNVFIVGPRAGKPALLWSIYTAASQRLDARGLIPAWQSDRAGISCRTGLKHPPGTCGPLYASAIALLPPEAEGRVRFFLDACYAQVIGYTIAKQTSIWRWDGEKAELLWIDWYDFLSGQKLGIHLSDSLLEVGEKEEFRTIGSCGACEGRPVVRRVRISPIGIEDLGKHSTRPELDLIDELFWRLTHKRPTSDVAMPQAAAFVNKTLISSAEQVGMLGDTSVIQTAGAKLVCFTADDIGRFYFTMQKKADGKFMITKVTQPAGSYSDCPTH